MERFAAWDWMLAVKVEGIIHSNPGIKLPGIVPLVYILSLLCRKCAVYALRKTCTGSACALTSALLEEKNKNLKRPYMYKTRAKGTQRKFSIASKYLLSYLTCTEI